ncbi:MAG: chromate transporter [Candidatus Omnitrophota bacterium]
MKKYLDLFLVFFKVSLFTIGGGLAMLPFIEREVTEKNNWIPKDEFLDIFGISQSMPGVMILNVSTTIGFKIAGGRGAVSAALGTALAPFLCILMVAWFFLGIKDNPEVAKIFAGVRPAVMALVVIPVITLSRAAKIQGAVVLVPFAVAFAIGVLSIHPAYVILAGVVITMALVFLKRKA